MYLFIGTFLIQFYFQIESEKVKKEGYIGSVQEHSISE